MTQRRLWRSFIAAITTMLLLTALSISPATAWDDGPMARPDGTFLNDDEISLCFGVDTSEGLYYHRNRIRAEFEDNWGSIFGVWPNSSLNFTGDGLCDFEGGNYDPDVNVSIVWQRTWDCHTNVYGQANLYQSTGNYLEPSNPVNWVHTWRYAKILLNADCEIDGENDWLIYDGSGVGATKMSPLRVLNHEMGHVLGLGHNESGGDGNSSTLMWTPFATALCDQYGFHQFVTQDEQTGLIEEYEGVYQYWVPFVFPIWDTCVT